MVKKDYLSWILDKLPESADGTPEMRYEGKFPEHRTLVTVSGEDKYRRNIDFVHSLGQKCDCVGWSLLDLSDPHAGEVIEKIADFCREDGWLARGSVVRELSDFESDWFALDLPVMKSDTGGVDVLWEDGQIRTLRCTRAYQNKPNAIYRVEWGNQYWLVASERFRDACVRLGVPNVRFCWMKDCGRYASGQYYYLFSSNSVPHAACDHGLRYTERDENGKRNCAHQPGSATHDRMMALGGYLPRIAEIFYDLGVHMPTYYPTWAMPDEGFAHVDIHEPYWFKCDMLIHRRTAEALIGERVLSPKQLYPVPLYRDGEIPPGYVERTFAHFPLPHPDTVAALQAECDALMQIERLVHRATDKQAAGRLRRAKAERKADFGKRMAKVKLSALNGTPHAGMACYYQVADGGELSVEYRFLSYVESLVCSDEFMCEIAREELLDERPAGIVIAACADGDVVLLCADDRVVRVSHDVPEVIKEWPNVAQFFVDALDEADE
ncbi:MAG: hypothetical protein IJX53_06890 [Clostridia bacterium]|nr:hypothetical protein [Clostridia bacterium]